MTNLRNASVSKEIAYPDIEVQLSGEDGNAFFIIGRVSAALKRGGAPKDDIDAFVEDAMSGDYNHVLQTVTKWVSVG
jgi:hypothetical protein